MHKQLNNKLIEGDIRELLIERLASFVSETLVVWQVKHPAAWADPLEHPITNNCKAPNYFKRGSAAGPNGLRPGQIEELLAIPLDKFESDFVHLSSIC